MCRATSADRHKGIFKSPGFILLSRLGFWGFQLIPFFLSFNRLIYLPTERPLSPKRSQAGRARIPSQRASPALPARPSGYPLAMPSTARGASPGRQPTTASSSSSSMPLPGPSGGGVGVASDGDDTAAGEVGGVGDEGVQSGSTTPSRRPPLRSAASSSLSSTQATLSEPSAPSPPPSSTPSPRPGFLSRFSLPLHLPLRNRNRHVADFHIRPDEPHRKYSAGGHVRGAVVLAVVKPLRITHLTVSLHGFVRVFREPTASAKRKAALSLPQGSSDRPQYHGHGLATLFQDEQVLSGEGRLDPGNYEFHFDLLFPETGLPSSIDVGAPCPHHSEFQHG